MLYASLQHFRDSEGSDYERASCHAIASGARDLPSVSLGAAVRACAARPFLSPGLDHELDRIALKRLRVTLEIALRRRREVGFAYVCWQAGVEPTEAFEPEQAIKHPRDVRRAGSGFRAALTGVSQTGAVDPRRRHQWGEDDNGRNADRISCPSSMTRHTAPPTPG